MPTQTSVSRVVFDQEQLFVERAVPVEHLTDQNAAIGNGKNYRDASCVLPGYLLEAGSLSGRANS
jgi:hypothetical protein